MKIVRLKNGSVYEIIPEYALPVEEFYSPEFAAQCMEAPDEVEQHWGYIDGQWVRRRKYQSQSVSLEQKIVLQRWSLQCWP